jgi:hypothetical protein
VRRARLDNALHFHSFTHYRAPPSDPPIRPESSPYSVADKGALAALRDSLRAAVGVPPAGPARHAAEEVGLAEYIDLLTALDDLRAYPNRLTRRLCYRLPMP